MPWQYAPDKDASEYLAKPEISADLIANLFSR